MLNQPMRATITITINKLHLRILNTMIMDTAEQRPRSQHMNHMLKMIGRDSGPAAVKEAKHLLPGQEPREPTENTHTEDTE
jgi:dihydrodipicolinate synthase/N-acetylneuraminate lyase